MGQILTIAHYDGTDWTSDTSTATTQSLNSVWGSSAGDVFTVGSNGGVRHYFVDNSTTTTTTIPTTTTSIASGVICPFSRAAGNDTGHVKTLRQLRQAKINNAIGAFIAFMYYQNMNEISGILSDSPELYRRFNGITRGNMPAARELLQQGSTTMAAEDVLEIHEFLLALQGHAGFRLRMDLDFLLRGMESGWLLQWLGIVPE